MKAVWEGLNEIFQEIEQAFRQTKKNYPKEVRCKPKCTDCCYALFDLSLAEAALLFREFHRQPRALRRAILRRVEKYEKAWQRQKPPLITPFVLSTIKIRCPLLNDRDLCDLYTARPATCRLYGIPVQIEGETFVCGFSGFEPGKTYPTVIFEKVLTRLAELSDKIAPEGGKVRVPLPAALRGRFPGAQFVLEAG
ncbi:MAG TPA: YkgJ family cysteine cluster protein [Thermodesulfatator atlanticus]|uniref:YkgJ family cysteine cluster protein n=1 Tax=Thermodesulfatator atlanticus TaxID=501497 RepID=A0A7V5P0I0_9BACT|nr:YkgJ family cysteine cluster protein [Thermodesulfatator atlanticus]